MKIFDEVVKSYGSVQAIVKRFKYADKAAVYNWKYRGSIPPRIAYQIHKDTGIPLEKLLTG